MFKIKELIVFEFEVISLWHLMIVWKGNDGTRVNEREGEREREIVKIAIQLELGIVLVCVCVLWR